MAFQSRTSPTATCGCWVFVFALEPVLRSCARCAFASMFSFFGSDYCCCTSFLLGATFVLSVLPAGAGLSCASAAVPKAAQTRAMANVELKRFMVTPHFG